MSNIASYWNNMQYTYEQYKQANSLSLRVQHKINIIVKLALHYKNCRKTLQYVFFQVPSPFDGCIIFIQKKKGFCDVVKISSQYLTEISQCILTYLQ